MTPLHVRPPTVGPQLTFSPSPFLTPRHSCHAAARLLPGGTEVPRGQGLFISASPLEPGPEQGPTGFWAPSPLAHMTLSSTPQPQLHHVHGTFSDHLLPREPLNSLVITFSLTHRTRLTHHLVTGEGLCWYY